MNLHVSSTLVKWEWDVCCSFFFNRPMKHEHFHETDRLGRETFRQTMSQCDWFTNQTKEHHSTTFLFIATELLLPNIFPMFNARNQIIIFNNFVNEWNIIIILLLFQLFNNTCTVILFNFFTLYTTFFEVVNKTDC